MMCRAVFVCLWSSSSLLLCYFSNRQLGGVWWFAMQGVNGPPTGQTSIQTVPYECTKPYFHWPPATRQTICAPAHYYTAACWGTMGVSWAPDSAAYVMICWRGRWSGDDHRMVIVRKIFLGRELGEGIKRSYIFLPSSTGMDDAPVAYQLPPWSFSSSEFCFALNASKLSTLPLLFSRHHFPQPWILHVLQQRSRKHPPSHFSPALYSGFLSQQLFQNKEHPF